MTGRYPPRYACWWQNKGVRVGRWRRKNVAEAGGGSAHRTFGVIKSV